MVELGAGLGLVSIVAAHLGMDVIATDGDGETVQLLGYNTRMNTGGITSVSGGRRHLPSVRVAQLKWGQGPKRLRNATGLSKRPEILVAADVIYGRDQTNVESIVRTMRLLCDEHTLVILAHGQGAAPGVWKSEGPFFAHASQWFRCWQLPPSKTDKKACVIHILRLKRSHNQHSGVKPAA